MSERTETTTNNDGSVTTITYDENGNVTCTSTVSGPGATVGIQAGSVTNSTVIIS